MMGAPDDNKGRPSLLGSSTPAADASSAATNGESTRVLAQLGGRESGARSFLKRPSVWAFLALLIGVAGATTYQLQSKRADASVNIAAAAPAKPVPTADAAPPAAPPAPEAPAPASAAAPAAPEPATARIVEGEAPSASQQQQQSTPFAAIGAQPMVVPPAGKSARIAAAKPAHAEKKTTAAAAATAKKPTQVASSKQPARTANGKPVKTAANTSKAPRRANDAAQAASRPGKPDPDTDLLTALLKRSKAPDPAPQPAALAEVAADCKSGQRCKP